MSADSCAVVIEVVARGSLATVSTFAHGPAWAGDPEEEAFTGPVAIATVAGSWRFHGRAGPLDVDASTVVLGRAGEAYRCSHPHGPNDVTLSVAVTGDYELPGLATVPRPRLEGLLRALRNARDALHVDALALGLLASLHDLPHDAPRLRPGQRRAVERAKEHLERSSDRNVTLVELASEAALSPCHLQRVFRAEVGVSPHAYLTRLRVERARALLEDGWGVLETALAVGYRSPGHFGRVFRAHTGLTPSEYRPLPRR
jgi:AraC-like DNA-binding protein